jgi:hypothetical protein
MAIALVVGNMVGSAIFTLPSALFWQVCPASIVALVRDSVKGRKLVRAPPRCLLISAA